MKPKELVGGEASNREGEKEGEVIVIVGSPYERGFMPLNMLDGIALASVVVNLLQLYVGWYHDRQYLGGEGCDAL